MVKLRKMRTTDDEDEDAGPSASAAAGRPAWMTALKANASGWLETLPKVS
jgi:hypothetical protein